jgi:hypothetical protein
MLGRMRRGGVPEQVIAYGADVLSLYVGATAYEESLMLAQGLEREAAVAFVDELRRYFSSLPPDRFPHIVALAGPLTRFEPDEDDRFEFGLGVLVDGLAARAQPPATDDVRRAQK